MASPQAVGFQHGELAVGGWLPGLRRNALGELLSLRVQPGALGLQPKKRKWHHLMRPWVAHLLASACRVPLHTVLLGSDGGLRLAPLPAQTAETALRALLDAWLRNLQQPLPLAPKTACAYLLEGADEAGRSAYEGAFRKPGERDESADLRRYFADYDSLLAVDGARDLWNALYGPLVAADWQALEVPA